MFVSTSSSPLKPIWCAAASQAANLWGLERLLSSCGSKTMVAVFRIANETDRLKNTCLKDAGYTNGVSWHDAREKLSGPIQWFASDRTFFFSARIRNLNTGELFERSFDYIQGDPDGTRPRTEGLEGVDRLKTVHFHHDEKFEFEELRDLLNGKTVFLTTVSYPNGGFARGVHVTEPYALDL